MHVYRFRILLEDVDEFYRDIEIMASSSFEAFHKVIMESMPLEGQELASFFICDGKWRRKTEITLEDMTEEGQEEVAPLVMSKCKLAEYIDDPHQKLIYVYDFLNMFEFNIELLKIIPADKNVKYPRCVRKSGIIPKPGSYSSSRIPDDFDEEVVYEDIDAAGAKDDDDTMGLYTINDAEGGLGDESPEAFEDEKFI